MAYDSKEKQQAYAKQHYLDNKNLYKQRSAENKKRYRREIKEKILAYLQEHPCFDCGETDPIVLQFDHVRGKKLGDVTVIARQTHTWRRVQEEMEKCEVVCANCHLRRTARRDGRWFRARVV